MKEKIELVSFYDYALAASRTLKKKATLGDNVGHYGLGVATEYFELIDATDKSNISEEIGDANWYLANHALDIFDKEDGIWNTLTAIMWGKVNDGYNDYTEDELLIRIRKEISKYSDVCKKHFAYEKQVDDYNKVIGGYLTQLTLSFKLLLNLYNLNSVRCLEINIEKLYDRYPDKFDSYFAMHRDLVKELATLDQILEKDEVKASIPVMSDEEAEKEFPPFKVNK